jgi:glutathione S-transferase
MHGAIEAQTISWMSFIASTVHPARRQGIDHAHSVFGIAEVRLANSGWALGRYSIADIHLFRLYWRSVTRSTRQPPNSRSSPATTIG